MAKHPELKALDQTFGIEGSRRLPELAALDRMLGIEGAEGARPLHDQEVVRGDVVAEFLDKRGHEQYLIETDSHTFVTIPKSASADLEVGESIEATRTGNAYSVSMEQDYGM